MLSDHNLILVVRKLTKRRFLYQQHKENVINIISKRLKNEFEDELKKVDWNEILSTDNLEAASACLMVQLIRLRLNLVKISLFIERSRICHG